jgi:hypothetical protein
MSRRAALLLLLLAAPALAVDPELEKLRKKSERRFMEGVARDSGGRVVFRD